MLNPLQRQASFRQVPHNDVEAPALRRTVSEGSSRSWSQFFNEATTAVVKAAKTGVAFAAAAGVGAGTVYFTAKPTATGVEVVINDSPLAQTDFKPNLPSGLANEVPNTGPGQLSARALDQNGLALARSIQEDTAQPSTVNKGEKLINTKEAEERLGVLKAKYKVSHPEDIEVITGGNAEGRRLSSSETPAAVVHTETALFTPATVDGTTDVIHLGPGLLDGLGFDSGATYVPSAITVTKDGEEEASDYSNHFWRHVSNAGASDNDDFFIDLGGLEPGASLAVTGTVNDPSGNVVLTKTYTRSAEPVAELPDQITRKLISLYTPYITELCAAPGMSDICNEQLSQVPLPSPHLSTLPGRGPVTTTVASANPDKQIGINTNEGAWTPKLDNKGGMRLLFGTITLEQKEVSLILRSGPRVPANWGRSANTPIESAVMLPSLVDKLSPGNATCITSGFANPNTFAEVTFPVDHSALDFELWGGLSLTYAQLGASQNVLRQAVDAMGTDSLTSQGLSVGNRAVDTANSEVTLTYTRVNPNTEPIKQLLESGSGSSGEVESGETNLEALTAAHAKLAQERVQKFTARASLAGQVVSAECAPDGAQTSALNLMDVFKQQLSNGGFQTDKPAFPPFPPVDTEYAGNPPTMPPDSPRPPAPPASPASSVGDEVQNTGTTQIVSGR